MRKVIFIFVIFAAAFFSPANSWAAVSSWQQSATILPNSTTDFSSENLKQSLRDLAATGANFVTLVVPYWQSNRFSTDIQRGWNTPTDESLVEAIRFAHSLGLKVSLAIHLDTYEGVWRAEINPGDRAGWFRAYGDVLNHYARMARDNGVERYVIGTELINMTTSTSNSTNTANWRTMIGNVKGIYSGPLTYSSNWGPSGFTDEKNHIEFWGDLDFIGIAAYFNLETGSNAVADLKNAWNKWNFEHVKPLSDRIGKPVIFTELGYKSVPGSHSRPWDFGLGGPADETEQANSYEALFSYWNDFPYLQGVSLWNWDVNPAAGGPGNTDYTPQNKLAEQVMGRWFGTSPGPSPAPPAADGAFFSSSAGADPASPGTGQPTTLTASVTNTNGSASGVIVDIEIYDSGGAKAFQRVFEGQSFTSGQTRSYTAGWTPAAAGEFKVKIGVFSSGWSSLMHWNDEAVKIIVGSGAPPPSGGGTTPPPPGAGTIDVWWPTDGVRVSGAQPFKVMLRDKPISDYDMFWQVDKDRLNTMFDNFEGYPHKEVSVDLSGWTWKGGGPYALNFIAKAKASGATLAERFINIFVAR